MNSSTQTTATGGAMVGAAGAAARGRGDGPALRPRRAEIGQIAEAFAGALDAAA